jgi:16S rRNA (guanine966-N2)-methyltransferase
LKLDKIKTVRTAAVSFLKFTAQKFDIIFADPPYDMEGIEEIPKIVFERELLEKDAWLIIEHSKSHDFTGFPGFSQQRHYGRVNFSIFK